MSPNILARKLEVSDVTRTLAQQALADGGQFKRQKHCMELPH
jgi:hypothetical protein